MQANPQNDLAPESAEHLDYGEGDDDEYLADDDEDVYYEVELPEQSLQQTTQKSSGANHPNSDEVTQASGEIQPDPGAKESVGQSSVGQVDIRAIDRRPPNFPFGTPAKSVELHVLTRM